MQETYISKQKTEKIRAINLKLFDTYGESDKRPKLINLLHEFATENKELKMLLGYQVLDLVDVGDVVNSFIATYVYLVKSEVTFG